MGEEIELRQYIVVLWKRKFWIAGLTIGAALVALVVSFLLPKTYEATTLVVATRPRYTVEFDPRLSTNIVQLPAKVYLDLATGSQLLKTLVDDLNLGLDVEEIRRQLKATSGQDPSVIKLAVTDRDPQQAARIANRWAELLVNQVQTLYNPAEQDLAFFQAQLDDAQAALNQAEQELIAFQAQNQLDVLNQRLKEKRAMLAKYLSDQDLLDLIVQDLHDLKKRLAQQEPTAQVALADELSALVLQMATYELQSPSSGGDFQEVQQRTLNYPNTPFQLQITDLQTLSGKTVRQQLALLDSLLLTVQEKRDRLGQAAQALEPQILELQAQAERYRVEQDRRKLTRDVAQDAVTALTRKVAETTITAQEGQNLIRVASMATPSHKPVSPRKLLNTAIAGMLGLMIGVFGALSVEWWKNAESSA